MNRGLLGEKQVRTVKRQVAVHLVGRNLMITLDAVLAAGIQKHLCAHDVGLKENRRIFNRAVNVALCREVDYDFRFFLFRNTVNRLSVGNISLDKFEMRIVHHGRKRFHVARVGQRVHAQNIVLRMLAQHEMHEVAADKSGAAGY